MTKSKIKKLVIVNVFSEHGALHENKMNCIELVIHNVYMNIRFHGCE